MPTEPRTALCVDDQDDNRALCVRLMRKLGYRVVAASSVRGALDLLSRGSRIDLILLDINMPEHTGFDAISVLKSDGGLKDIPIIVVSNSSNPHDGQRAMAMGAAAFVGAPVEDAAIEAAVLKVTAA